MTARAPRRPVKQHTCGCDQTGHAHPDPCANPTAIWRWGVQWLCRRCAIARRDEEAT